ncbi:MAG: methyltransferase domain-containing protein [Bacteroidia bacterium]
MIELNKDYWNNRYIQNETGWDIGYVSTPLKNYFDQIKNKDLRILIPGCGNGYEAEYLFKHGFKNVFIVDIAPEAVKRFKQRVPEFPNENIFLSDFFELKGSFDLIIEQTFFCALNPELRTKYVQKMHELLVPKGKLVGLLFNCELNTDHPPFGGFKDEYQSLFSPLFTIKTMETCYNSIEPRKDRELFIILEKK